MTTRHRRRWPAATGLSRLVDENATIDAKALIALKMPNRDAFIPDPRPDVKDAGCTK
jgi:cytochrome c